MKIETKDVFIVILFFMFTLGRFFMPHHEPTLPDVYKAMAHIFVGGLFGAYFASKDKVYLFYGLGLTFVELIAFFAK